MFFRNLVYESGHAASSGLPQHVTASAYAPAVTDCTPADLQTLIEELFSKEGDVIQLALSYAKQAGAFGDRLFRRYRQYEPGIRREARRLLQFLMLTALRNTHDGEAEQRTVDSLLRYLYSISLTEAAQTLPDYVAQPQNPAVVFARHVWDITGVHAESAVFMTFVHHVSTLSCTLGDLFARTIQGFAIDPHGIFAAFVATMQWPEPQANAPHRTAGLDDRTE